MRWLGLLGLVAAATLWALGRASAPPPRPDGAEVVREPAPESATPAGATLAGVDPAETARFDGDRAGPREQPVARVGELRSLSFRPVLPDGRVPERVACEVVGLAAAGVPGRRRTIEVEGGVARFEVDLPFARSRDEADEIGPPARAMLRIATAEEDLGALSGAALLSVEGVFAAVAELALRDLASGGGSVALGVIHLEPPPYLGEVVFAGTWTDLARLEVSRGLFSLLRRTVQTSRRRVPLWAYGASRSWSVSVTPRGTLPVDAGATLPPDARSTPIEDRGLRGDSIELSLRFRSGLDLSVDLFAAPRAGRVVILSEGADPAPMTAGRTLARSAYNERIGAAIWTNVVPRGPVREGRASYDIGPTDLPEGVLRLELWSIDDDRKVRELLAVRKVSAGTDMPRISLP